MTQNALLIEDREDVIEISLDLLDFFGATVTVATNIAEAIAHIQSGTKFSYIVLDGDVPLENDGPVVQKSTLALIPPIKKHQPQAKAIAFAGDENTRQEQVARGCIDLGDKTIALINMKRVAE